MWREHTPTLRRQRSAQSAAPPQAAPPLISASKHLHYGLFFKKENLMTRLDQLEWGKMIVILTVLLSFILIFSSNFGGVGNSVLIADKSIITSAPSVTMSGFYWNLSCPIEWSKYSCIHQGQKETAERSARFALNYKNSALWGQHANIASATSPAFLSRRVVMIGDSLIRQVFIALTCRFANHIAKQRLPWAQETGFKWPCHESSNCVPYGVHSGFSYGMIEWKEGGELHIYSWQLSLAHKAPILGTQMLSRMIRWTQRHNFTTAASPKQKQTHQMRFIPRYGNLPIDTTPWQHSAGISYQPLPESTRDPAVLDILVINPGVHHSVGNASSDYALHREMIQMIADYGQILLQRRRDVNRQRVTHTLLPYLVYMTTPAQHFNHPENGSVSNNKRRGKHSDGIFRMYSSLTGEGKSEGMKGTVVDAVEPCLKSIDIDPRREIERELLQSGKHIDSILDAIDMKELGDLHIGRGDCTHYCMPGIPDISAYSLVHILNKLSVSRD